MTDVDADFECQHVGLAHRALADYGIDFVASALLIVHHIVFDVADHVLRLLALDAIAHESAGKNGILAHVLERPSVARLAREVHAAAERHVVALIAKFASDQRAVFTGGLRVPARSRSNIRRQRCGIASIGRAATNAVRSVAHLNDGNSEALDTENKSRAAVPKMGRW